jgi:hypothetical protein
MVDANVSNPLMSDSSLSLEVLTLRASATAVAPVAGAAKAVEAEAAAISICHLLDLPELMNAPSPSLYCGFVVLG